MKANRAPLRGTIVLALILVLALVVSHLAKAVLPRSFFESRAQLPARRGRRLPTDRLPGAQASRRPCTRSASAIASSG